MDVFDHIGPGGDQDLGQPSLPSKVVRGRSCARRIIVPMAPSHRRTRSAIASRDRKAADALTSWYRGRGRWERRASADDAAGAEDLLA